MPAPFNSDLFFRKTLAKPAILSVLTLSFFLNPLIVGNVEADYLKLTAPAEILQNGPFDISLEVAAKPNTSYALKGRLGVASNQMTKAQTFAESTGVWLSDSVSWDRFPQIQTDSEGHWKGILKVRPSSSSALGKNLLVVRLRDNSDGSTKDSEAYQITLIEPQIITPIPPKEENGEPILNEFLAAGGPEWVEIKNKGNGKIDLSDWLIDDEEGKSSPFVIPQGTIVGAGQFYVAHLSSPKLNDIEDSVRLLKPDNTLVEEYRYSSPEKGKSFAKDSAGAWFIPSEPTPGSTNPNQPILASTTTNTNKTKVLAQQTNETAEESPVSVLPKLTSATDSAKIATVSASFKNNNQSKNLINKLPFLIGGLLVLASLGIFGKNFYQNYKSKKLEGSQI